MDLDWPWTWNDIALLLDETSKAEQARVLSDIVWYGRMETWCIFGA